MDQLFDERPHISEEIIDRCISRNDYKEYLYETLKFLGVFISKVSCIDPIKSEVPNISEIRRTVFIGIINRISRLILSYIHLSEDGLFGETASIIERCLFESCLRLRWLIQDETDERVKIFICDSLKKDVEFKEYIESNEKALGYRTSIGTKLCDQIQELLGSSFVEQNQIKKSPRMPSFDKMCKDLELDPIYYLLFQRQRSHSIHGSWTDLYLHYLRKDGNKGFVPRDHDVRIKAEQFLVVIRVLIETMTVYLKTLSTDAKHHDFIDAFFKEIKDKIMVIEGIEFKEDRKRV